MRWLPWSDPPFVIGATTFTDVERVLRQRAAARATGSLRVVTTPRCGTVGMAHGRVVSAQATLVTGTRGAVSAARRASSRDWRHWLTSNATHPDGVSRPPVDHGPSGDRAPSGDAGPSVGLAAGGVQLSSLGSRDREVPHAAGVSMLEQEVSVADEPWLVDRILDVGYDLLGTPPVGSLRVFFQHDAVESPSPSPSPSLSPTRSQGGLNSGSDRDSGPDLASGSDRGLDLDHGLDVDDFLYGTRRRHYAYQAAGLLPGPDTVVFRAQRLSAAQVSLTPAEWSLLGHLAAPATPRLLAHLTGAGIFATSLTLVQLAALGLVGTRGHALQPRRPLLLRAALRTRDEV
jgi:hypothetical protein